ncbi:MAG: c(7)-type cytochrome triheme domain-containing protein [Thermodesulfovibrionales bacterium]
MSKTLTVLLCLIVLSICGVLSVMAVPTGKTVEYSGGGFGKVIFDGKIHADKDLKCNDCHTSLFSFKTEAKITMADHKSDKYCFKCHNGSKAFTSDNNCGRCHKK